MQPQAAFSAKMRRSVASHRGGELPVENMAAGLNANTRATKFVGMPATAAL
jgi:hypothetical protein